MSNKCPKCEADQGLLWIDDAGEFRCQSCGALLRLDFEPVIELVDANPPPVEPPKASVVSQMVNAESLIRIASRRVVSQSTLEQFMKPAKPLKKDQMGRITYDIFSSTKDVVPKSEQSEE